MKHEQRFPGSAFSLSLMLTTGSVAIAQPQPGTRLWVFDAGTGPDNPVQSSPAVAPDGTIYFGAVGTLYAITNRGSNAWVFPTGEYNDSSPAIAPDGTIYYSSMAFGSPSSGYFYAVNPDGSKRWSYLSQSGNGSPSIALDNTIYIHGDPFLQAVSPAGTNVWKFRIGGTSSVFNSPAIAGDGSIAIPSSDNSIVYNINSAGVLRWQEDVKFTTGDSAAIGADGTLYITAGPLYAISPSGTNLWLNQTNVFFGSSPSIGKDGTIYVATQGGSLCAFTPSGELKWQAITNGYGALPGKTPAIDAKGTIYLAVYNTLYAVNPDGSIQWTFSPNDGANTATSPTIGPDGTIYTTFGGKLYAICNTNKLADSPWPMYRQNARHTGKVEKPSLQQPKKRADANFEFQLYAQIDQTQNVQSSSDLLTWNSLTNIVVTNVPMDVVDLCASNFPSRFYRTLSQ